MKKYLLFVLLFSSVIVRAQSVSEDNQDDLNIIELELEKSVPQIRSSPRTESYTPNESNTLNDFKGLSTLAPFKEISVIQKRYLPKTGRGQFFGGGAILTNNPFFNLLGFGLKASYFLSETWGLELNYMGLSNSESQSAKELFQNHGVSSKSFISPESFLGLDLVYVPIYGKMAWFNDDIISFDLYFSAGYGTTKTTYQNAGTFHLAAGQVFAISKSTAFRWDFSLNSYSAKNINQEVSTANDLFLTVGMSFFFPGAKYR